MCHPHIVSLTKPGKRGHRPPEQLLLIENVDLSKAEARFSADKERIDRSVSEDVGFDEMNRLVREALVANLYTARAVARKAATFQSVYM